MYTEDVRQILTVLCTSRVPLTTDEVIEAHTVDLKSEPQHIDRKRAYSEDDIVDICLGLVEIASAKNFKGQNISLFRISHFSVQEYLQSDRILQQKASRFAIQNGPANAEMAQICLVYLLNPMLSNDPTRSSGPLDEKNRRRTFMLAKYSAKYWYPHYQDSGEEQSTIECFIIRLFSNEMGSFHTWVSLHDVDSLWPLCYTNCIASPLYYAALLGLEFAFESIISLDSSAVNTAGGSRGSALQAASLNGNVLAVKALLHRGAHTKQFEGALYAASLKGNDQVAQLFLDLGVPANSPYSRDGRCAFEVALQKGHSKIVQKAIDRGVDVNAPFMDGNSALAIAAFFGHAQIVQAILQHGGDVDMQGGVFGSPLEAAVRRGHLEIARMLLDQGAKIGNSLQYASYRYDVDSVNMLLDQYGADIDSMGTIGGFCQTLHFAEHERKVLKDVEEIISRSGILRDILRVKYRTKHEKTVKYSPGQDANINIWRGLLSDKALQEKFCAKHNPQILKSLREVFTIIVKNGLFGNALQVACFAGHAKMVQILIQRGADITVSNRLFGDALQIASFSGHEDIVQVLLKHGLGTNAQKGLLGEILQTVFMSCGHGVDHEDMDFDPYIHRNGMTEKEYFNMLIAASVSVKYLPEGTWRIHDSIPRLIEKDFTWV